MDESQAYKWAAQALTPIEGTLEVHKCQQVADKVVGAILAAYKLGSVVEICDGCTRDKNYCICDAFKNSRPYNQINLTG